MNSPVRTLFCFFLITSGIASASALDLTDLTDTLAGTFFEMAGDNEGTTGFRSLLIPQGGRSESLGGAFTGLCDDVSYIDYNPAASAILENTEIAFFHNAWIADSAMETIAATTRFNNFGIGGKISCFYVPFSEYDSFGIKASSSYYSETTAVFNAAYNFHPGYRFRGLSLGTNIKAGWRAVPDYADNDTNEIISDSGIEQSALAFMADVGILTQFNIGKLYSSRDANFKVGLSINNLGAAITGFTSSVTLDDPLPSSIGLGLSYKIIRPVTLALEFRQPFNLYEFSEYQMFYAGSGVCVDITDFFSVLGGFQLKGANPRFSLGGEFEIFKMRFNVNYTLDLTSSINPLNRISVSAKIKLGDKNRHEKKEQVDALYREGLMHYTKLEYNEALECWHEALKIDKYFDPAKEAIISTEKYIKMLEEVNILNH